MRAFVVFATLFVVALARPDIGLKLREQQGYNYQSPGSSGGHSSGGHSSGGHSSGGHSSGGHSSGGQSYGGHSSGGHSSGGQSYGGHSSGGHSSGGHSSSSGGSRSDGHRSGGHSSGGSDLTHGQSQYIDLTGGSSGGGSATRTVVRLGEPVVSKHFYVHEAPDDESSPNVRENVVTVRPQTHYKIIFIKAPSSSGGAAGGGVPAYPQNQEKTIVYVLSKKNEFAGENGEFPTPPPPVTSKPEVFFVKYNSKADAEQAVNKIQESFQEGGPGYNSPAAFAASLGATSSSGSSSHSSGGHGGSSHHGGSHDSFDVRGNSGSSSSSSDDFAPQVTFVQSGQSSQSGNGGGSTSSFTSGGGSFGGSSGSDFLGVAQQMLEISQDDSAFGPDYLPPRK